MKEILILLFLVSYSVLGGLEFRRWRMRHPPEQAALRADPRRWLAYWLPQGIVFEAYVLVGGAILYAALAFIDPTLHGADEHYLILGGGIALIGYAAFFVCLDIFLIMRARLLSRRAESSSGTSSYRS